MATFKQNTGHANNQYSGMGKSEEGFGRRDEDVLKIAFPDSPYLYGTATNVETVINNLGKEILQGEDLSGFYVDSDGNVIGAEYWGSIDHEGSPVNVININYANAPNTATNTKTADEKEFGAGKGAPETPYIPPLTSPGEGNTTAHYQPGFGPGVHNPDPHVGWGSGDGGLAPPSESTIGTQTIGDYTKGDS